jgi:dTMP kinase
MNYHISFDIDFRRNVYPGKYIAFEGIDGSGKTAQVELLKNYFQRQGKEVVLTREPRKGGSVVSDLIGKVLLGDVRMSPVAFQFLASADRVLNQEEVVIPALISGKIVLSDRSFWSVVPYAILDKGISYTEDDSKIMLVAQGLLSMYHQFIVPDMTFFLDVSLDVACERIKKKRDEAEIYEKKGKLRTLIKGYQWLLQEFANEFCVVDADRTVAQVNKSMVEMIGEKLRL